MSIDPHYIFNTIITLILGGVGWFAKQIWDAVQELKKDVHEIEVDLPRSYVTKGDFHETMRHIEDMFKRIYDKLENKADK
jgi:hypothetical protein